MRSKKFLVHFRPLEISLAVSSDHSRTGIVKLFISADSLSPDVETLFEKLKTMNYS